MEAEANSDMREEAQRSRGGHSQSAMADESAACLHGTVAA